MRVSGMTVFSWLLGDNNYDERSVYGFEGGEEVAADAADLAIRQRIR